MTHLDAHRPPVRGVNGRPSLPVALGRALAWLGVLAVLLVLAWAIAPSLFTGFDPTLGSRADRFLPPSLEHPLGTDHLGRDMYARVVYGTRETFLAAGIAILIGTAAGTLVGLVTATAGSVADSVGMRAIDVLIAVPSFLITLVIITAYGKGPVSIGIGVGVAAIAVFARVARAEVVRVRNLDFVEASLLAGSGYWAIVGRRILPNILGTVLSLAVVEFSAAIIVIASLGYLGLGSPPPTPEWGLLVAEGRNYLATAWWIGTLPGVVLAITVVSLGSIGRRIQARFGL